MAIEFHCNHCGKMIKTSDEHAGKNGRCPSCHQTVYIPTPPEQIELLKLAPLDDRAEIERDKLLRETRDLQHKLLREREVADDAGNRPHSSHPTAMAPKVDVETLVIEYAISMADGNLADAQELAAELRKHMKQAENVMQRITVDEIPPPQLARIPRPVLVGFFKQLREKK
ncbi:MAG: hypothetical protein U1D55_13165 [Phycisphaerae bacterium]